MADSPAAHEGRHLIERVSLADAAEVELHALALEANRPRGRVEDDPGHADERPRRRDGLGRREPPLAFQEPPAAAQGRARDVEGARRLRMQAAAPVEQGEEVRVDRRWALGGGAVHAAELARLAEDAERRLQAVGLVQRFARGRRVPIVRAVEEDLEAAGHGCAMDADPVAALLRAPPEREELTARPRARRTRARARSILRS